MEALVSQQRKSRKHQLMLLKERRKLPIPNGNAKSARKHALRMWWGHMLDSIFSWKMLVLMLVDGVVSLVILTWRILTRNVVRNSINQKVCVLIFGHWAEHRWSPPLPSHVQIICDIDLCVPKVYGDITCNIILIKHIHLMKYQLVSYLVRRKFLEW